MHIDRGAGLAVVDLRACLADGPLPQETAYKGRPALLTVDPCIDGCGLL
jgi:hypothetical protein